VVSFSLNQDRHVASLVCLVKKEAVSASRLFHIFFQMYVLNSPNKKSMLSLKKG
jgi:hypothetical protein